MKACRIGSLEYYMVGDGSTAMLSVGKIHGNEPYSRKGLKDALDIIDKRKSAISYVAVPEVNPHGAREYDGVDVNRDFSDFRSSRSRELRDLVRRHNPVTIVDHHDNNYKSDFFFAIISNTDRESLDYRLAKRLVEHICCEEGIFEPLSKDKSLMGTDLAKIVKMEAGIYCIGMSNTLVGYFKKGMGIEVPAKNIYRGKVSDVHRECDLFLKEELERLARDNEM